MALERAITDLGADLPFKAAAEKIREHYRIEIPQSTARLIVEKHAKKIGRFEKKERVKRKEKFIISESDGSLIPIVEIPSSKPQPREDLRKKRAVCWKEVKLSFARGLNTIDRIYGGVIGRPEELGQKMLECAKKAGMTEESYIHAIGDGAPWIEQQVAEQFGRQGHYLIDFFHLCEYLSEAAIWMNALEPKVWLNSAKERLKEGKQEEVFKEIKNQVGQLGPGQPENGLVRCLQYMEKRQKSLNYKEALERGLPIGSGEIESSHRHVVQKRLKIAGAWWKTENANAMLNLRIERLNGNWESYWQSIRRQAA